MGFWAALDEVYPTSRQQRCWQHKTMNVLNCLPKLSQLKAKAPCVRVVVRCSIFLYFSGGRDRTMTWDIHRNENQLC